MGNRKFYCKGVSLYTVFLWVAILAPLCNTFFCLLIKKKFPTANHPKHTHREHLICEKKEGID